jgi:hypothetical protein
MKKKLALFAATYLALFHDAMAQSDVMSGMASDVGNPLWKIVGMVTVILLAIETVAIVVMIQSKKIDNLVYWIIGAVMLAAMPSVLTAIYEKWNDSPFGA